MGSIRAAVTVALCGSFRFLTERVQCWTKVDATIALSSRVAHLVSDKGKGGSLTRHSPHLTRITYVVAMTLLAGCVTPSKVTKPLLASRYYGTWRNALPQWHNWWEISPVEP